MLIENVTPLTTPQECYSFYQNLLNCQPDGTGLQILFEIENEYYVLAGPRQNSIITVNGGRIEEKNSSRPFLDQLQEELQEETFGVLDILHEESKGYQLSVKDGANKKTFLLEMAKFVHLNYQPGKYAYVTFTAICRHMNLDQLKKIANAISPTADFWAQLGNFLFPFTRKQYNEQENFTACWQNEITALNSLLETLTKKQNTLGASLLITPSHVFKVNETETAWNYLRNLNSLDALKETFKKVGDYSERSGYYVFQASALYQLALDINTGIKGISGEESFSKLFNAGAVSEVFSKLKIKDIPAIFSLNENSIIQQEEKAITAVDIKLLFSSSTLKTSNSLSLQFFYYFMGYCCGKKTPEMLTALCDGLKAYQGNLTQLHFKNCNLEDNEALAISEAICINSSLSSKLTDFKLENNNITEQASQRIKQTLLKQCSNLNLNSIVIFGARIGLVDSSRAPDEEEKSKGRFWEKDRQSEKDTSALAGEGEIRTGPYSNLYHLHKSS